MRVSIPTPPYVDATGEWSHRGRWPAYWVTLPEARQPFVAAYRLEVEFPEAKTVRVHVTADERYELFLNGVRVGRGSERGDANYWFFETYDLDFRAGINTIVARSWALGIEGDVLVHDEVPAGPFAERARAPYAQISVHPGFLFSPDDRGLVDQLATGVAAWHAKSLGGYEFIEPQAAWGTGAKVVIHGDNFDWGFETGGGSGWVPVKRIVHGMDIRANDANPHHVLKPGTLPAMLDDSKALGKVRLVAPFEGKVTSKVPVRAADHLTNEAAEWSALIHQGTPLNIPAHTQRRVLIDLDNYYCAYPELQASGGNGTSVRIHWQECLFENDKAHNKGNRNEIEGKYFTQMWSATDGVGDTFLLDGGAHRRFDTLWWECGRYVEILVATKDEAVTIERLTFRETRYPLESQANFESSEPKMAAAIPMMERVLQMCSHESYMDCPFYEQLMYVGDTRLDALTTYAITPDDRLPRKALRMFDISRRIDGITQSRYPSRVLQLIPPFSLWWVAMIHDFALWRGDMDYVKTLMPGARAVLDHFRSGATEDGLVVGPNGWNFMDWVPEWHGGIPPEGDFGVSSVINLQAALVLRLAAELEDWLHEPELAARNRHWADRISHAVREKFWVAGRGLFADDVAHTKFSEHAQCLAVLGGVANDAERSSIRHHLVADPDLSRTTIYFSHYLFETFRVLGLPNEILKRLEDWYGLVDLGLKTTIEHPEPTRSDCHAWGAHPLFHYFATLAGVRPTAPGFGRVDVHPQLGSLTKLHAKFPTVRGPIEVRIDGDHLDLRIPEGIRGKVTFAGETKLIG